MTAEHIDEIRTLLEKDLEWRIKEISLAKSLITYIQDENTEEKEHKMNVFRKSILLSLYAHFEGFFKSSFEIYVAVLNDANLALHKVVDVLFVSSLHDPFIVYDESSKWIIRDPERKKSERIMNRLHLVSEIKKREQQDFLKLPIATGFKDKSNIVATESNLTPEVLDKILYSLGIPKQMGISSSDFEKMMGMVSQLVRRRNAIAHGDSSPESKSGVTERELNDFEMLFNNVTGLIMPIITRSLAEKNYLKEEFRN